MYLPTDQSAFKCNLILSTSSLVRVISLCIISVSYIPETLTQDELAELFGNRVFVDYFNLFLNLPVFSQKILYKFSEQDFEFEPPIRRTKYILDKKKLICWLLEKRIPYFLESDLYVEYQLCEELIVSPLHLSTSTHSSVKDEFKVIGDVGYKRRHIGHVKGMQNFRRYLAGSPGETLFNFWMDVKKFHRTPLEDAGVRFQLYREMQIKYFQPQGITKLPDPGAWNILIENFFGADDASSTSSGASYRDGQLNPDLLTRLQEQVLQVLRMYWFQKYMIHCRAVELGQETPEYSGVNVRSMSDLRIIQDLKNLDHALALAQGTLRYNPQVKRRRAGASWRSMFPKHEVDDDFLKDTEDVVVSCGGGKVYMHEAGPGADGDLEVDSSASEWSSDEEEDAPTPTGQHDALVAAINKSKRVASQARLTEENLKELNDEKQQEEGGAQSNDVKSKATSNSSTTGFDLKLPSIMNQKGMKNLQAPPGRASVILPPINRPESPLRTPDITTPRKEEARISTFHYTFQNTGSGTYRFENCYLVSAVLSDFMAGNPFRFFLANKIGDRMLVHFLDFIGKTLLYTSTKCLSDGNLSNQQLRLRRAKYLLRDYFGESTVTMVLPPGLTLTLRNLLVHGKGNELLRHAQEFMFQRLKASYVTFWKNDQVGFTKSVLISKEQRGDLDFLMGIQPELMDINDFFDTLFSFASREEKHTWAALRLGADVCGIDDNALPNTVHSYEPSEFDPDDDKGSLCVKQIIKVKRRDLEFLLEEERHRQERIRARQRALREAKERERRRRRMQQLESESSDKPFYLKPIRRNGAWVYRPPKPKHFTDLLRCSIHLEYLKRFLVRNKAETPLLFWMAVEDLKRTKDPKRKQQRTAYIVRKYFNKQDFHLLNCTDDVVKEIPNMQKVTLSMLMSAQTYIIRCVEEKWYHPYLETFIDEEASETSLTDEEEAAGRSWGKEKTRALWIGFVRSFVLFRRCIHDPVTSELFRDYLRKEVVKEIRNLRGQAQGVVNTKKVIRNRLVAIDKLMNDYSFLVESDKYLSLCDNVRSAATSGHYKKEDEDILETKAKTIVECFFNSEVPPRLQINVSQDMADTVLETYQQGMLERGLFHDAMMAVMPVIIHLWKRFVNERFLGITADDDSGDDKLKGKEPDDFMQIDLGKVKTINTRHAEDDGPRILFSLAHGMRILLPVRREEGAQSVRVRASRRSLTGRETHNSYDDDLVFNEYDLKPVSSALSNASHRVLSVLGEDGTRSARRGSRARRHSREHGLVRSSHIMKKGGTLLSPHSTGYH